MKRKLSQSVRLAPHSAPQHSVARFKQNTFKKSGEGTPSPPHSFSAPRFVRHLALVPSPKRQHACQHSWLERRFIAAIHTTSYCTCEHSLSSVANGVWRYTSDRLIRRPSAASVELERSRGRRRQLHASRNASRKSFDVLL